MLLIAFSILLFITQSVIAAPTGHKDEVSHVSEDLLHYALHAVHPHFKDGVFASNQQAMEALEQADKHLAAKVYALAKRQANTTATSESSQTPITPTTQAPTVVLPTSTPAPEPTTPYLTTSTSSFASVITSNGQTSTFTALTVVVRTQTPTKAPAGAQTNTVNPSLQSGGVRTGDSSLLILLLAINFGMGLLWMNL